jgi:hypothetical protein
MLSRCYNKNNKDYARYGGRGIVVADAWRGDFPAFLRDMGQRPSIDRTLDRIDNDGPYSPANCRWATKKEQCCNQRTTRLLTFNGITDSLAGWASRTGLSDGTISYRLSKGMALVDALTLPAHSQTRSTIHREHLRSTYLRAKAAKQGNE